MKARLWRLIEGPQWADAVEQANPCDGYFEDNLESVRDALGLNPRLYSTPFLGGRDDTRIFYTNDTAAGYRVFVFFRLDEKARQVELGWIELEPIEQGTV